jgi:hypothetical protein
MKRLNISIATGVVLGVLLLPGVAYAGCGDGDCAVGAAGMGGERSAGRAEGFRVEDSFLIDNQLVLRTNVGNADAGRVTLSGAREGTLAGTFRYDIARGRGTGRFGDWAGQCELASFPC